MTDSPRYRRVLVKLSGESFSGTDAAGIDRQRLDHVVAEFKPLVQAGAQVAVVVGAGNWLRGRSLREIPAIRPTTADGMGMVATVLNGLALRDALAAAGVEAEVLSAFAVGTYVQPFSARGARALLDAGKVVIFVGGTGCPFFTTDTCAALRASEIEADILIKATKVDGVFDSDPMTNPRARKYDRLTVDQVLRDELGVMDMPAFALCREKRIPIVVVELFRSGSLAAAARGEPVGTFVEVDP